jgi:hypothetical protein
MNLKVTFVRLALVSLLAFASAGATTKESSTIPDLSKQLKIALNSKTSMLRPGTTATLDARLVNISAAPITVIPGELARYVDYDFEPEGGEGGAGGELIGDSVPGGPAPKLIVLAPGDAVSRAVRFPFSPHAQPSMRGHYEVSVDYCHFRGPHPELSEAPEGCVTSNKVRLLYEP